MDQFFKESAKQIYPFEHYKLLAKSHDPDEVEILNSNDKVLDNNLLQIGSGLKNLKEYVEILGQILEENGKENEELRESLTTELFLQNLTKNDLVVGIENMKGTNKEWRKSLCKTFVENYVALVSVESPTNTVAHTERDIRDSLVDKLGIIGGTIGLFTGFSLLSLLEIVFLSKELYDKCFKKNAVDDNESDDKETKDLGETGPRGQSLRRRSTLRRPSLLDKTRNPTLGSTASDSSHHEWESKFNEIIRRLNTVENVCNVTQPATLPGLIENSEDDPHNKNLTSEKSGDIATDRNTQDYEKDKVNQ